MNRLLFGIFLFSFFGAAAAQEIVSAPFDPDSGNITWGLEVGLVLAS